MLGKLKIGSDEDMEAVLESLIVRMTPCPNEFGKFYVLTELMLEETHVRSYCRHFSQEYLAHFSRIFQLVLSTPKTLQIYLKVMDKLYADLHLKERPALPRRSKENVEPGRGKYSGWLCGRVELVNRVSWNIVLSVNANCDALAGFGLQRWVSGYLKLIQEVEPVELKKCLSLNMKYLALGYSPHFNSAQYHALLFAPLATTLSDHIVEFLLALLAAVFTHPLFAFLLIDQDQLHTLVAKVRHIDASGTFDDHFIRIYPALYALFVKMFEAPNQDAAVVTTLVKELRAPLIEEELHSLEEFARSEDEMDVPALKRSIFYFEKLHAVSRYLRGAFGGGEKTNRGFPWLVKHHLQWVVKCLGTYEYKHYQFSEQLKLQTRDTYESNEMNTFRESYVALATDYILLAIVRTEQESVDDKLNP